MPCAIPSSTERNGITESTGPKISSRAIVIEFVTPSKMVGSTKKPLPLPTWARPPPATTWAPSRLPASM